MDFNLTEEHLMIKDAARDFAQTELLPGVIERDNKQEFPDELVKKMGDLGFLGIMVDQKYGGSGMDSISYVQGYDEGSSYYGVYTLWQQVDGTLPQEVYSVQSGDIVGGADLSESSSNGYGSEVVQVNPLETVSFDVTVTNEGLYEIYFDYYLLPETLLRPSITVKINDELQYNEMANIEVPTKWLINDEPVFDRYGDELTPNSTLLNEWNTFAMSDPNYYFVEPLKIYLPQGESTIDVTVNEGHILFGDIQIGNL